MSIKALDGARIFEQKNSQVAIILFHAYTGSPMDVNLLGRKLFKAGYSVYMPQFYGHNGESVDELFAVDPMVWFEQGEAVVEYLLKAQGYPYVFAFGLSLGGMIASYVLSQNSKLIGGGSFNSPLIRQAFPNLDPLIRKYIHTHQGNEESFNLYQKQSRKLHEASEEVEVALSKIEKPYFLAQSGQDELLDPMALNDLPRYMPQATINHYYYPKNTHVITVASNRTKFEDDLLYFITYFLKQHRTKEGKYVSI